MGRRPGRAEPRDQETARAVIARQPGEARLTGETAWRSPVPAATNRGINYWPGFVDALSTLVLSHHLPAVGVRGGAVLPVAGGDRQGHGAGAAQRPDRAAHRPAVAGKDRQARSRGPARAAARRAGRRRKPSATASRAYAAAGARRRRRRAAPASSTRRSIPKSRFRRARWRRSRCSTSRSPRCAASSPRSRKRSRPRRSGTRNAGAHRRSRPAAQRRAGAAGAGTVALPLGILRQACARSSATGRTSAIVGDRFVFQSEVFFDTGQAAAAARGPRRARTSWRPRWSNSTSRSRPTSPGCCGSTATPTCGRSPARCSSRTGNCRRRARSRWCSIWSSRLSLPSFSSDSRSLSCAILALSWSSALSLPVTSCDRKNCTTRNTDSRNTMTRISVDSASTKPGQ